MHGSGLSGVCLVHGDSAEQHHPMMHRLLHRSGVPIEQFWTATSSEPGLLSSVVSNNIKVIVPLGERALREVLGQSDILRWRGRAVEHHSLPGVWVVPMFQPSQLMSRRGGDDEDDDVMRHPPRFHGVWHRDLHFALSVAKQGFTRQPVDYLLDPDAEKFEQWVLAYEAARDADPENTFLSFDVETAYSINHAEGETELGEDTLEDWQIIRWSFSYKAFTGVSLPESPTFRMWVKRLLEGPGQKVGWNCAGFDVPVIGLHGTVVKGPVFDAQDAFHLLHSDLPKGLEWSTSFHTDSLPWKHLSGANPALYSAIDADVALREFLGIREELKRNGQWDLFVNHVVRLMPILAKAGEHGNLMDVEKREEIRSGLIAMRDTLVKEIQTYVPRALFPRKVYKSRPDAHPVTEAPFEGDYGLQFDPRLPEVLPEWDVVWVRGEEKVCTACGQFASNKTEHFKGSKAPKLGTDGQPVLGANGEPKLTLVKNPCKAAGGQIVTKLAYAPEYHALLPWNPNSTTQLLDYMRHHGHPLGQNKKDSSKDAADATHLKKLHKAYGIKFPLYAKTLVVHKVSKTIGTYTPEPDANGLLHTQFVNSTSTWRLGSRKVKHGTQIQNWGKRKDDVPTENADEKAAMKLSQGARKQIIARPGHKLIQIDSAAVEAVLQGYFMNDPDYMNLASQSIHAWLTCRKLGIEFTPANVDFVKDNHAGLYSKFKVTNYLTNFGGGPRLMHDTYPEDFPSIKVAQDTQDMLYALLPSLREYHHATRWEAHTKTYLETPWGYRHSFYDVFKKKPDGSIGLAKDSKRCVAFRPQNSNAAFQRDNILLMACSPIDGPALTDLQEMHRNWPLYERAIYADETWARYMPTNVTVHDSLCLDCPDEKLESAAQAMLAVFTRPIPQMRGLVIGAEVEQGLNWAEMDRVTRVVPPTYTWAETAAGTKVERKAA